MTRRRRLHPRRRATDDSAETEPPEPFSVDIATDGDAFVVTAELPGVRTQDIDVTVRKNRLRIDVTGESDDVEGTYLRRERNRPAGSRVVELPGPVVEKRASASYNGGVLRLRLPKRDQRRRVGVE
ncbi:Hsp20/alpha crystallin family protein [Haloarcula marina]|uniref:Hsp20/alpha crystallin family protein n=1 Tax=Haloarcula marina TaxID=2961574 RepID=UPI0020B7CC54|nr:Hsp20/alpha crystallin family protein [Halomicroarcula marina]